jgi:predicted site-specific integrase-resolvase
MIESTKGNILVLYKELANDILSIITVFSFRLYELRSRAMKNKIGCSSENIGNNRISKSGINSR